MTTQITSEQDVRAFLAELKSVHPDDDIFEYFSLRAGSPRQNELLDDCFAYCDRNEIDITTLLQ